MQAVITGYQSLSVYGSTPNSFLVIARSQIAMKKLIFQTLLQGFSAHAIDTTE